MRVPASTPAPPQHCPTARELDDLELLTNGALGLPGFSDADGPVPLHLPPEIAAAARDAGAVELVDPEGLPLARVEIVATYEDAGGHVGVTGPVTALSRPEHGPFRRLHQAPGAARDRYDARWLTVPVAGALGEPDLQRVRDEAGGRPVLLLALTGHGMPRGLSGPGLVRATLAAATVRPEAAVVAVPLAARGGRDTGGGDGLLARVLDAYAPGPVLGDVLGGTATAASLPAAVAGVVARDRPGPAEQGLVLFFTGLSGSGKSTLARALHDEILERGERTVTSLDGDVVRRTLSAGLTFSRQDRETNILRIGWVAAEVSRHGGVALCSPIAPFEATRRQVRETVEAAGGAFVLIHVATPLEECERRDRKGLYAKARRGEIPDFTGISSPYEEPEDATVRVDTTGRSIAEALADVLAVLDRDGRLGTALPRGAHVP